MLLLYIRDVPHPLLRSGTATSLNDEIETSPNNKWEHPKVDSGSSLNTAPALNAGILLADSPDRNRA